MLKRTCGYLDVRDLRALERIGQHQGSLKLAPMIRVAISDDVAREENKNAKASVPSAKCCTTIEQAHGFLKKNGGGTIKKRGAAVAQGPFAVPIRGFGVIEEVKAE